MRSYEPFDVAMCVFTQVARCRVVGGCWTPPTTGTIASLAPHDLQASSIWCRDHRSPVRTERPNDLGHRRPVVGHVLDRVVTHNTAERAPPKREPLEVADDDRQRYSALARHSSSKPCCAKAYVESDNGPLAAPKKHRKARVRAAAGVEYPLAHLGHLVRHDPGGVPVGQNRHPRQIVAVTALEVLAEQLIGVPDAIEGPAIAELPGATLVVPPGWHGRHAGAGTLVMEREHG